MIRKKLLFIVSCIALMTSACASQQSATSSQQRGIYDTKQLLLLMDKDQNGKVSRAEFMNFMNSQFDQLDINHDGELDVDELTALHYGTSHPGGGVGTR